MQAQYRADAKVLHDDNDPDSLSGFIFDALLHFETEMCYNPFLPEDAPLEEREANVYFDTDLFVAENEEGQHKHRKARTESTRDHDSYHMLQRQFRLLHPDVRRYPAPRCIYIHLNPDPHISQAWCANVPESRRVFHLANLIREVRAGVRKVNRYYTGIAMYFDLLHDGTTVFKSSSKDSWHDKVPRWINFSPVDL